MAIQRPFEFVIQWHLTERCNLACRHCYQDGPGGAELSSDEVFSGIDEIDELFRSWSHDYGLSFSPSFNITGGEPLLRDDCVSIVETLARRRYETFLLTNGTLVTRSRARELAAAGLTGAQVSIEGCIDIHDGIRGPGSFGRASDGIEHLLDAGVKVNLNVTLSRLNAGSMKKVVTFASHIGVHGVGFSRLVPAGKGAALVREMLPPGEVRDLYRTLLSYDIENLKITTGDPVAAQLIAKTNGRPKRNKQPPSAVPSGGCAAGVSGLTIQADGTLVPCRRLPIPIGNLRTDSLREVWALSPVLAALRDKSRYGGACGVCDRWGACRGCRAIAYAYSKSAGRGDFLAEDPQCFLRQ